MTDARQLRAEVAHWRLAVDGLADLDMVASPSAWEALEQYLHDQLRRRLSGVARSLRAEADALARMFEDGVSMSEIRRALLHLRARFVRFETLLDFFGDAVASRTSPALAELLRGYDIIASDSMSTILRPLGIASPPALVYQDSGLGASILRAGIRLWDQSHPSPAAAIKITRHNLFFPTSLLHETGHQVLALTGYNDELRETLRRRLAPKSTQVASLVSSWASEMGADVHAIHHAGWAPVMALANVVDGSSSHVFRIRPGDPHPPGLVRVVFNCRLLKMWFGAGPWDDLAAAWLQRHPVESAHSLAPITPEVVGVLDNVAEICSMTPMRAFRGSAFGDVLDPRRVSPSSLDAFERQAGATVLTSTYLQRQEPIRILALLTLRSVDDPERIKEHRRALVDWVRALGRTAGTRQAVDAA